jgi:PiT family inorganic phosphate transporter
MPELVLPPVSILKDAGAILKDAGAILKDAGAIIVLVACSLLYSFLNGLHDGANTVATVITSRALPPRFALWMVAAAELSGPFVFGVAVAKTIAAGVVDPQAITVMTVVAALVGASAWNVLTWRLGIPASSSHALIGGLLGSVITRSAFRLDLLHAPGLIKVASGLFLAPVVSLAAAYVVMEVTRFLLRSATPRVNWFFGRAQLVTTIGLALSHGANDAPKTMGIIVMGLVSAGLLPEFGVPGWVIAATAVALAAGTLLGGWRLIRTLGTRFYRVRPIHAFTSQITSGLVVFSASVTGLPVSTSQVVSSAIAGVGAAERFSKVRWRVMREIVVGWLLTIPATAVAGGLVFLALNGLFGS